MSAPRTEADGQASWSVPVQVVRSPGGIDAWLIEDHSVPVLALAFAFAGGAALDPPGQEGRAALLASLLTEGAGPYDTAAYASLLRERGVTLAFEADRDGLKGTLRCLVEEGAFAAEMLALALAEPRFDQAAMERARAQRLLALRREAEQPPAVASRRWWAEAFPSHPFARPVGGTEPGVSAIDRAALLSAREAQMRRGSLVVAAAGAVGADALGRFLDRAFAASLADGNAEPIPAVPEPRRFALAVVELDAPQATGVFGHIALPPEDPAWEAAQIANWILGGGGFSSRLMTEVREKRGLTYGIGTGLLPFRGRGLVLGSVATDNARFGETLAVLREEWGKIASVGPTEEEVEAGKAFLTGSFPLGFTSTAQIASTLVGLRQLERAPDWLAGRIARLAAISVEEVREASRRLFDPAALSVVVAGRPTL